MFPVFIFSFLIVVRRKSLFIPKLSESLNLGINNLELVIMPNPVTQQSVINVKGATGARITVYNNIGQAVINNIIDEPNYIYNIGHTQLKTGIYLVTVRQNGQTITSQKMVITK